MKSGMAKGVGYVACTGNWNTEFQPRNIRGHLEDMAVVRKMLLKQILREQVVMMWFWFKKLSLGKINGLL
jgi:hypothetical protein